MSGRFKHVPLLLIVASCLLSLVWSSTCAIAQEPVEESRIDVYEKSLPTVVKIFGSGGLARLEGYGSGILISKEGHILTVWSHLLDRGVVTVVLNDGRRFEAKRLGAEPSLDLAILKIEAEDLPFVDLTKAKLPAIGTRVIGLSNMFKVANGDEPVSAIHGVVAAVTPLQARRGSFDFSYQGAAIIVDAITNNPGAAGGLLVTTDGTPIGMIGKELKDKRINVWINYAIPLNELAGAAEEIITGKFKPADYGKKNPDDESVTLRNYVPSDLGIILVPDVVRRTPCYVDHLRKESFAAGFDLKPDDLILFVNQQLVQSQQELKDLFGAMNAGDPVELTVRRGNRLHVVKFNMPLKNRQDEMP